MTEPAVGSPLRPLTRDDAGRVVELERALFGRSAWSRAMVLDELDGPGRWYIGVDGPEQDGVDNRDDRDPVPGLLAYAGSWFDGQVAQVMTLGVARSAQRRGWGARLLEALLDHARGLGAEAALLEVRVDNEPAIALYERFGFETIARRARYYQPEDKDAYTMRLPLDPSPS